MSTGHEVSSRMPPAAPVREAAPPGTSEHARPDRRRRPRLLTAALLCLVAALEATRFMWWTTLAAVRYLGVRRSSEPAEQLGALLRDYLLRMGPLYVKAGQVLGTQSGLLPKTATDAFRSFFSDLPAMSERSLRRTLDRNLPDPVEHVFAWFEVAPIAVGSVAQVHRAQLPDGTAVVVKVVKRGVNERLRTSSWLMSLTLSVAHAVVPGLRRYDLPGHFAEIRPLLVGQCDMRAEAEAQNEIALNFRNHPHVRVPATFADLSGDDVLVMEHFIGTRGQDVDRVDHSRPALAERLQDAFYCMAYFHGVFHVDPHPGNIMFGPSGEIQLLDFGLVGRLTEDEKWELASFYYACVRREWALAIDRFTRAFVVGAERLETDPDGYRTELVDILRRHFESETSRWSTMEFLDDATLVLRRRGARLTTAFSLLALAFLTGEGFISMVDPDIDIWGNARRFTDRFSPYMSDELQAQFERELGGRMPHSTELRRAADEYLVAPTHLDRFVLPSAFPLIVESASGCILRDVDGNSYVDLSCGYGPHILGYAHPRVVGAISRAASDGAVNALGNPAELRLARLISDAFPGSRVVLSNSGTEAVLMALKIARAFTGRDGVAKFEGHYHGFSDQGTVSSWFRFSGDRDAPEPVENSAGSQVAVVRDTLVLQYGEQSSLDRIEAHADHLACVVLEPMPAALGGYDADFLRDLRDVCTRTGVLLVFDEVVTGFRVAYGGVQHLAGVVPDLTCLGKVVGGGLPCGAVVGSPDVVAMAKTTGDPFLDVDRRAFVGGTMSGNSITAAAGAAVLDELREGPSIYAELRRKTSWLTTELTEHASALGVPVSIRGAHSIFSVTFDHARPRLLRDRLAGTNMKANIALAYYLRRHGVYMPELHTMMLSVAHSDRDLEHVSAAYGASLREMADNGFFPA